MDDNSYSAFIKLGLLFIFIFFVAYLFKRLRVPGVISFLLLGLFTKNLNLLADKDIHHIILFKELGVILLFFFIGLEYNFNRLRNMLFIWKPAIVDFVLNFVPAFILGLLLGLNPITSLIFAGVFYPTSTAVITKLLTDFKRLAWPETELLIGILIFEDLIVILILSLLIPLKETGGFQFEMFFSIVLKLLIVLAIFYVLYRFVLHRLNSWMNTISEDETFPFLVIGFVMLVGFAFKEFGISETLGAFLLGVLVAETPIKENIASGFYSLREISIGIFFFFFTYEVHLDIPKNLTLLILLTIFGIILKVISTYIGAYLYGMRKRIRLRASLSFVPRGEFSVVLSSLDPTVKVLSIPFILGTTLVGVFLFAWAPRFANIVYPKEKSTL